MTRVRALVALACMNAAMFAAGAAHADSSEGGAFILPGYGARAWGAGGAVVARIDDESAVDWNPAGMARAARMAGAGYVELVPNSLLNQAQVVYVMPFGSDRDSETGVSRHAAGAMFTNISADVGAGETYSENFLRLAYAYSPQPVVTVGIAGQGFISRSGVPGFDGWGTSIDLAARLAISVNWSLAMVGRDVFSRYTYNDGNDYNKEPQYVLGLAREHVFGLALEGDIVYVHDGWLRAMLGAETPYLFDAVALRGGMTWYGSGETRTTYSFGASVRAGRLLVHYAATVDNEDAFGTLHRFSLGVGL